jgi:AraC-like DNA-binding protein
MKPILEHLPRSVKESFVVKFFEYDYYPTPWHYHPEYELVLVTESTGKRFIGDDISDFKPGNLAFIGPNLPHLYRNDPKYYEPKSRLRATSIVVHFLEDSFGEHFLNLPETEHIRSLFDRAARGMDIFGKANALISKKLQEMLNVTGFERWMILVEILHVLSTTEEYNFISTHALKGQNQKDNDRLSRVIERVIQSFQGDIRLDEIADEVNMSPASFSRYFKQRTRKTFSQFVTEIRLSHASKLLQEDQLSISEICFACGFNNLSNFNRQFKVYYKLSPLQFKKQYR